MSDTTNLDTAISAILTELAASAGKPNYSIDGQSVDRNSLLARLKELTALRNTIAGPFEVESLGDT